MNVKKAFALPSIVVTGTVLMIVLVFTLNTTATTSKILRDQHAQLLAKQAGESGLARARQCLYDNDRVVSWSDTKPLRPNTDCRGNEISGKSAYLTETTGYRTTFEVKPNDLGDDNSITATTEGKIEYVRKKNTISGEEIEVYKKYNHFVSLFMNTKTTFNDITFGNIYAQKSAGAGGVFTVTRQAYYLVKTKLGLIKYAGSNVSYQLTGNPSSSVPSKFYMRPTDLKFPPGTRIAKIFANYEGEGWNVFYLTTEGNVYGTGTHYNGQLGTGQNTATGPIRNWNDFIDSINNFFNGVFGFLTTPEQYVPEWYSKTKMDLSELDSDESVVNIFPNGLNTYILTNKHKIYSAGLNAFSLGHENFDISPNLLRTNCLINKKECISSKPSLIKFEDSNLTGDALIPTAKIFYNRYYFAEPSVLMLTKGGAVFGWGNDSEKNMGRDSSLLDNNISKPQALRVNDDQNDGKKFGETGGVKAVDVATDGGTSWIVDENGDVWSAGNNSHGQLGRSDKNRKICAGNVGTVGGIKYCYGDPIEIQHSWGDLIKICKAGWTYSLVKHEPWVDNKCWRNIGFDTVIYNKKEFRKLSFPSGAGKIIKVVASYQNALFLTDTGKVYGVGRNDQGQLGNGSDLTNAHSPVLFQLPTKKIIDLYITSPSLRILDATEAPRIVNSFVITDEGEVYGAGSNYYGQLGIGNSIRAGSINNANNGCHWSWGDTTKYRYPQKMKLFGENGENKARAVKSGFGTTMVITDTNRVFTVGNNSHGQLGVGICTADCEYENPRIDPAKTCTPKDYDNTNLAAPLNY